MGGSQPVHMKDRLQNIVAYKKAELASQKRRVSLVDVQLRSRDVEAARAFLKNFKAGQINIIAEIKKASPSAGILCDNFRPRDVAQEFAAHGAAALSILTDEHFFMGSLGLISAIKKIVHLPCLRKDFTLDEYQIYEARAAEADSVLLIVAILDDHQLRDYQALARELGMMALVEVHNADEIERALKIGPDLVGMNNRDLKTFKTSVATSKNLAAAIPSGIKKISESGLDSHLQLAELCKLGCDGFLIGEALMKAKHPGKKLKEFLGEKKGECR